MIRNFFKEHSKLGKIRMPPSQLKKLKSSLREQGITGVQKSKKQKRQASKNGAFRDARLQRSAALQSIREQFNPFEVRASTGASKYHVASNKPTVRNVAIARPGVTKGLGEEKVWGCRAIVGLEHSLTIIL